MGVRSIEAVGTIIDGILRHLPLIIGCSVEEGELSSMVRGWVFEGVGGKRGLVKTSGGLLSLTQRRSYSL